MKAVYYVAASLDGFIASEAGGVEWLDEVSGNHSESSYESFYADVDGLLMGRGTYDFVYDYGTWPYGDQPCWVVTSKPITALAGCNLQETRELTAACLEAQSSGIRQLWVVGGGQIAAAMLQEGLLTHIQVTLMPIALGGGIRLIDSMPSARLLEQEQVVPRNGSCEIIYRIADRLPLARR